MNEERARLSEILIEAMKSKSFSVEKLAEETGISDRFLGSLIGEEFEKLPSKPYVHGYLVKVGAALGLNGEQLWKEYLKDRGELRESGPQDELPGDAIIPKNFNKISIALGVIAVLVIVVYAFFQVRGFVEDPHLNLQGFEGESITIQELTYDLQGQINPQDQLSLNGEEIYPDEQGNFEKELELQPGFNTLNFTIKKFLGSEYQITKQIFVNAPEELDATIPEEGATGTENIVE